MKKLLLIAPLVLALSACGTAKEEVVEEVIPQSEIAVETEIEEVEETQSEDKAVVDSDYEVASWASDFTPVGELIDTVDLDDVRVDIYFAGTVTAEQEGVFVDADTKEAIVAEGDEIAIFQYIATNNGSKAIDLGSLPLSNHVFYPMVEHGSDMGGLVTIDQYADMGLSYQSVDTQKQKLPEDGSDPIYTLEPGASFSTVDAIKYLPGEELQFNLKVIPVDADGRLIHDEGVGKEVILPALTDGTSGS